MSYDQNLADCEKALNEANKLLEQTIEVLEEFATDVSVAHWHVEKALPLLEDLKAKSCERSTARTRKATS